jgi:hypothetical protein
LDCKLLTLLTFKREYKRLVNRKKLAYKSTKSKEIEGFARKSLETFGSTFKKNKGMRGNSLSTSDFYQYFKNLSNEINITTGVESERFASEGINSDNPIFSELDNTISETEVLAALKTLKCGKVGSTDNLINELFIESGDILTGHLTDLFNLIIDTGFFPDK